MQRRSYLGSVAGVGLAGTAGCLDALPTADDSPEPAEGMVLVPPEQDLSAASHPSYGEEFPAVELPDPLTGESIATDQFEDDRTVLMTFFYTSCPDGVCPALLLRLRRVQEAAAEEGYGDDVALLAMTFDPERDSAEELEAFADQQGVDLDAGNWHFLRPEEYETAEEIVDDRYGLGLEKRDPEDDEDDGDHEDDEDDEDTEDLEYVFPHLAYIFLVNERGLVERAYPRATGTEPAEIVDDVEAVVSE